VELPGPSAGLVFGGTRLPVLAGVDGLASGADVVHVSLRRLHGRRSAADVLSELRDRVPGPLVVEPFSADDLADIARHADGVLVGAAWMQDFQLLRAVGRLGLPTLLQRGHYTTVDEWLGSAEYLLAEGTQDVVLCESGSRTHLSLDRPALDLALVAQVRERSGLPVVVDVSSQPVLAGAAVAAGADGVFLAEDAAPADVALAVEATTTLTPIVRPVNPGSLPACREAIDRVDATLASLLEYRATLATEVQTHKAVPGHAGRDPRREAEIVVAMAGRAPDLGVERMARIVDAVISTGLDLAEERLGLR
jgi:chorismate mutase